MGIRFKKYIFIYFIVLFLIIICFKFSFNYDFSYNQSKEKIVNSHILNKDLFVNLKLDNMYCSFDKENDICYFYLNFEDEHFYKTKVYSYNSIDYITQNGYNVSNQVFKENGDNFILLYNDKYYYEINVKFVKIPVININYMLPMKEENNFFRKDIGIFSYEDNVRTDNSLFIQLYDNYNKTLINDVGSMHVRGATSATYGKKSYRLELNKKKNVFGMRRDEDWILDALFTDKSKIRNKFSSDIWNLINNNQYINNDLGTKFVELFINNDYKGLYVFKEPVDYKTVSINSDGILVKVVNKADYDYKSNINNLDYSSDFILAYELRYPKHDYSKWKYFFNRRYPDFFLNYIDIYDEDNFLNMMVFLSLINGKDNDYKNLYLSMSDKNSNILITPWDMDLTWGLNWNDDDNLHSIFSVSDSYSAGWLNEYLFKDIDLDTMSLIKKRYWELRKDVITMDTINSYLDSYEELLVDSGAAKRDSDRWYQYDVLYEIENIREWASRRIDFLDEYFK